MCSVSEIMKYNLPIKKLHLLYLRSNEQRTHGPLIPTTLSIQRTLRPCNREYAS